LGGLPIGVTHPSNLFNKKMRGTKDQNEEHALLLLETPPFLRNILCSVKFQGTKEGCQTEFETFYLVVACLVEIGSLS